MYRHLDNGCVRKKQCEKKIYIRAPLKACIININARRQIKNVCKINVRFA